MATQGRLSSRSGLGRLASRSSIDLSTTEGLRKAAEAAGINPPEKKESFSAFRSLISVLNTGTATSAGIFRGIVDKNMTVGESVTDALTRNFGVGEKEREFFGFREVMEETFKIKPKTFGGKAALFAGSLAADILFDPLTYITFGMSRAARAVNITDDVNKVLTKEGTKLANQISKDVFEKQVSKLTAAGTSQTLARQIAGRRAPNVVNTLFKRALEQAPDEIYETYLKLGVSENALSVLKHLGPKILDKGGIKIFGKTLVSSKTLAKTPVGKAARALGQTEIAKALKNSLGKIFVADYGQHHVISEALDGANRASIKKATELTGKIKGIYKNLDEKQVGVLHDFITAQNKQMFRRSATIQDNALGKLRDIFPKLKKEINEFNKLRIDGTDFLTPEATKKLFRIRKAVKNLTDDSTQEIQEKALPLIDEILGTRAVAKKEQLGLILNKELFGGDPDVLLAARKLFDGNDSFVSELARLGGISQEDAFRFYIPTRYEEKLLIRDFAVGKNLSSPRMGFTKAKTGLDLEGAIKDPVELYARSSIEIAAANAKSNAIRSVYDKLGNTLDDLGVPNAAAAKRLDMVEVAREVLGPNGKETIKRFFHKDVAEQINRFAKSDKSAFVELSRWTGFDYATGIFKGYVTSLFPGFHVRNITSNQFQNMLVQGMDVMNPNFQKMGLDIALGRNLDKVITTKAGIKMTLRELRDQVVNKSDILTEGAFSTGELLIKETAELTGKKLSRLQALNPASRQNIALRAGRKIGTKAEQQAKMTGVIAAVMRGQSVDEGIELAELALFNYGKLSTIERDFFRRIIPFYTFARKNAELQIKSLARNPGRVAAELKIFNNLGDTVTSDDIQGLPDYILDSVGVKMGKDKFGRDTFFSGFGLPMEEFLNRFSGEKGIMWNFVQNTLAITNPIIKFPLERATGVDFFRDRPITELTNAQDLNVFLDAMPPKVSDQFKELISFRVIENQPVFADGRKVGSTTKYRANPFALHIIRNLPSSRVMTTVGFLQQTENTPMLNMLRVFTGVKGWSIDQEEQKFFKDLGEMRELQDWLVNLGVLKRKEIVFSPK